jgi:asparagine synthase (glutamine-hydrolysing)
MCGITGVWTVSANLNSENLATAISQMSDTLSHRGPDDRGIWQDSSIGIGFGHRRLAILDLSPQGHQPMISASGRYVITYKGEIYNFLELRKKLEKLGHSFRSNCDTEVILASFEEWGIVKSMPFFNEMFALGVWDRQERLLSLARDPIGEKPLYYSWMGKTFLFASELKAPNLIERPKIGFEVSFKNWLRGPLREWADSLLDEKRLRQEGFLDPHPIRQKWLEHLEGKRNWHFYLWDILMFQAWLEDNFHS